MRFLVFDTETTGIIPKYVKNSKISMNNLYVYPHIVQLSYVICSSGEIEKNVDTIGSLPPDVVMSQEVINIHGITNKRCREEGVALGPIILEFVQDLKSVDVIIGHNIEFDINMITSEIFRNIRDSADKANQDKYWKCLEDFNTETQLNTIFPKKTKLYCTMKETTEMCNIEAINIMDGKPYIKWPTLGELHYFLFRTIPKNLHNSLNDVFVCLRCYYKLKYDIDICNQNVEMNMLFANLLMEI